MDDKEMGGAGVGQGWAVEEKAEGVNGCVGVCNRDGGDDVD